MGDLIDSVGAILSRVERRVEVASQNISNVTTPGYKRAVSFESVLDPQGAGLSGDDLMGLDPEGFSGARTAVQMALDFTPGQPMTTDNPGDLAILGNGFFNVRANSGSLLFTRQGQFTRDASGHLVTTQGAILQQSGGGDLVLKAGDFKVLTDGTVMQAGEAVGRIAIYGFSDPAAVRYVEDGLYDAPADTASMMNEASVSQGALESSNVSLGAEMLTIMAALREAQSGQRIMGVYDDLMGRAISTFGQV